MAVASSTLISDTVLFVRNLLRTNVTDPIGGNRSSTSKFVMTSYPRRKVEYPLITVKLTDLISSKLGMQTDDQLVNSELEVRVWARNVQERDELTQQVYTVLRTKQSTATTGSYANSLNDFAVTSMTDVDEDGEQAIRSKIIMIKYMFIST